jgi:hypothetical protein
MITAEALTQLTTLKPYGLSRVLHTSGYTGASFKTAEFTGISNGGLFVYRVTYHDDAGLSKDPVGKVYVRYDSTNNKITADY